jgi:hypothetical protein
LLVASAATIDPKDVLTPERQAPAVRRWYAAVKQRRRDWWLGDL